jgi:hypothetical protein
MKGQLPAIPRRQTTVCNQVVSATTLTQAAEESDIAYSINVSPTHVAAAWSGHTTAVADKHYRQTTEEHFAKALKPAQQKAQQSASELGGTGTNREARQTKNHEDFFVPRGLPIARVGDTGLEPVTSAV